MSGGTFNVVKQGSGPAASVAILAKAAVSEARSAQSNLRQQLQVTSSIGLVSPPVSHWG